MSSPCVPPAAAPPFQKSIPAVHKLQTSKIKIKIKNIVHGLYVYKHKAQGLLQVENE